MILPTNGTVDPSRPVAQLLRFLKALGEHRDPLVRSFREHPWVLEPAQVPIGGEWSGEPALLAGPDHGGTVLSVTRPGADELPDGTQAAALFESLYELHSRMRREAEHWELVVGNGVLVCAASGGDMCHPVVTRRVRLDFDPAVPRFSLRVSAELPELESRLLAEVPGAGEGVVAGCRRLFEEAVMDGEMGGRGLGDLLAGIAVQLSPRGVLVDGPPPACAPAEPVLHRYPVVLLRRRRTSTSLFIDAALDKLRQGWDPPPAIHALLGNEIDAPHAGEPPKPLLTGRLNPEQQRVVDRVGQHPAVLVQGPPGTGKTHTIASLVGNLLASGSTVLVTSHTRKALQVLRDQVDERLRSLCVSDMGGAVGSQDALKSAVEAIIERLGRLDPRKLQRRMDELEMQRSQVEDEEQRLRAEWGAAVAAESLPLTVGGVMLPLAEALAEARAAEGVHDWLPGDVDERAPFPLDTTEVTELSAPAAGPALGQALVDELEKLPSEEAFAAWVETGAADDRQRTGRRRDLWAAGCAPGASDLTPIRHDVEQALTALRDAPQWKLAAASAGIRGARSVDEWEAWLADALAAGDTHQRGRPEVELNPNLPFPVQQEVFDEVLQYMSQGGRLSPLALSLRPRWKDTVEAAKVGGTPPADASHFEALRGEAARRRRRAELASLWSALTGLEVPDGDPERLAAQIEASVRDGLGWYETVWRPVQMRLEAAGFRWKAFLAEQPPQGGVDGEARRLLAAAGGPLGELLVAGSGVGDDGLPSRLLAAAEILASDGAAEGVVADLRAAVSRRDRAAYLRARRGGNRLVAAAHAGRRREQLIARIEAWAPAWAASLRDGIADEGVALAGDPVPAWRWRQIRQQLDRRRATDLEHAELRLAELGQRLQQLTTELAEARAWAAQRARTGLAEQQALVGYLDVVRRIGKGTGKRAPRLRAEARRLMARCATAVPAWVMPLDRVLATFNPGAACFDVVILDEASQSDIMGVLAWFLGRRVVVVGDHEQVSPDAVGQKLEVVEGLIEEHLCGVPNSILYDGQTSVYDLARQSFGGLICLLEHFRCPPEIIAFSNRLSYGGRIRPVRLEVGSPLGPRVVSVRVPGGEVVGKVNQAEATRVASLVAAACEAPEFGGLSLGVISMVGDEQALAVDRLLRDLVPPQSYADHGILCGGVAHFQGDERDVVFLSMVDANASGSALPLRGHGPRDMFKKRFNVASSRAREQLWVVHSLDPRVDLKPGDLRRQLIEFALATTIGAGAKTPSRTGLSALEERIFAQLVDAGFAVDAGSTVAGLVVPIMVQAPSRRVLVDCYGPDMKLDVHEKLARRRLFERLGWPIVTVTDGRFSQEPEKETARLLEALTALGALQAARTSPAGVTPAIDVVSRVSRRAAELLKEEH